MALPQDGLELCFVPGVKQLADHVATGDFFLPPWLIRLKSYKECYRFFTVPAIM